MYRFSIESVNEYSNAMAMQFSNMYSHRDQYPLNRACSFFFSTVDDGGCLIAVAQSSRMPISDSGVLRSLCTDS